MLKKTIYLLIAAIVVVTSCKKDDKKTDPPTVTEAKATMTDLGSDLGSDISEAMSSEGVDAIFSAMNLLETADPFTNKKKNGAEAPPSIEDLEGTYEWNEAKQDWDIDAGNPAGKVIVKFPVDTNAMSTNNGVLTISSFTLIQEIDVDDYWTDTNYYPASIAGTVVINDVEIVNISFTASYDDDYEPTSINASITMVPITLTGSFSSTATSYTVSQSLKLSGTTVESVSGTANFVEVNDMYGGDTWDSVYSISGFVHYDDIKIKGSIQLGELESLESEDYMAGIETHPEIADYNKHVDLAVYTYVDEHKIADIEFYEPTSLDAVPVRFVFTDETVLSFEDVINPMIDEIEKVIVEDFGGNEFEPIDIGVGEEDIMNY